MKKIISLFLALTMCFILCIPTLAYEQAENAAIGIDEFISINLEEISPNEEAMAVVRQEAELLNKFLGLDGVSIKITEDDKTYVYEKVFPNDVVDYIRVGQDDKGVITFKCANINAGSVIGSLTVTAITMIISKAVVSIFASPIAGDAVSLFAAVATELKTEAQENAPDSAYFSYNYSKYKYPDSPLTDSYFRYFGLYYPKKDLVGSPATSDIFEHCVNSYI